MSYTRTLEEQFKLASNLTPQELDRILELLNPWDEKRYKNKNVERELVKLLSKHHPDKFFTENNIKAICIRICALEEIMKDNKLRKKYGIK